MKIADLKAKCAGMGIVPLVFVTIGVAVIAIVILLSNSGVQTVLYKAF